MCASDALPTGQGRGVGPLHSALDELEQVTVDPVLLRCAHTVRSAFVSVGTSIFFRSSVMSVSEKALIQKYAAGIPAIIPCSQKDSRTPSKTFAPGRL